LFAHSDDFNDYIIEDMADDKTDIGLPGAFSK
jgi:hypothetical protein